MTNTAQKEERSDREEKKERQGQREREREERMECGIRLSGAQGEKGEKRIVSIMSLTVTVLFDCVARCEAFSPDEKTF
jgi:hypothetical protein